jgi:hypothetical protein
VFVEQANLSFCRIEEHTLLLWFIQAVEDGGVEGTGVIVIDEHVPHALAQYKLNGCPCRNERFDVQNVGNACEK